jgi:hypothetical protein
MIESPMLVWFLRIWNRTSPSSYAPILRPTAPARRSCTPGSNPYAISCAIFPSTSWSLHAPCADRAHRRAAWACSPHRDYESRLQPIESRVRRRRYDHRTPRQITDHCDIVETGNDGWRFKSRSDYRSTRTRLLLSHETRPTRPARKGQHGTPTRASLEPRLAGFASQGAIAPAFRRALRSPPEPAVHHRTPSGIIEPRTAEVNRTSLNTPLVS